MGAAMELLNALKPGLDKKLYEKALIFELESRRHAICCAKRFQVTYREKHIGTLISDMIVDDNGHPRDPRSAVRGPLTCAVS